MEESNGMKSGLNAAVCLAAGFALMIASAIILSVAAGSSEQENKDIMETAVMTGNFTMLAKALEEAGLADTLKGAGPFTIFAPTDEAFAKIPAEKLEALMQDKELLKKLLLTHVISGKAPAKDLAALKSAKTLGGSSLEIRGAKDKLMISNAHITQPDIAASNGVIHVIDTVIMPVR
jgi:uncharacterized surface protein with fasciclin (FAS1) repeats